MPVFDNGRLNFNKYLHEIQIIYYSSCIVPIYFKGDCVIYLPLNIFQKYKTPQGPLISSVISNLLK